MRMFGDSDSSLDDAYTISSLNKDIDILQQEVRRLRVEVRNERLKSIKVHQSFVETFQKEMNLEILGLEDIATFLPEYEGKLLKRRIERIKNIILKAKMEAEAAEKEFFMAERK